MGNNKASAIETISATLDLLRDHVPSVAHFPTLATASPEGIGCARLVVLRGMHASKRWIWFNTHAKAHKVRHLRANPHAELALWVPERAIQLRILAKYQVVSAGTRDHDLQDLRGESWREQPEQARAMYAWPKPEKPVEGGGVAVNVPRRVGEGVQEKIGAVHGEFVVLLGTFYRIDALELTQPYHTRYVHTWEGKGERGHWETVKMTP